MDRGIRQALRGVELDALANVLCPACKLSAYPRIAPAFDRLHRERDIVLVDQRGAIRGYYDSEDAQAMKNLVRDAGILSRKIAS